MGFLGKLKRLFGGNKPRVDPVAILPVEITQYIFRQLDGQSLLNVAQVSPDWQYICEGDAQLRRNARSYLRELRRRARESRYVNRVVRPSTRPTHVPICFAFGPSGVACIRIDGRNAGRNLAARGRGRRDRLYVN